MGKLILYRMPGPLPMLQPVNALGVDNTKAIVLLEQEVNTLDGMSSFVPIEQCFEFDADLMQQVNRLVGAATDALTAARIALDNTATPLDVEAVGLRDSARIRH